MFCEPVRQSHLYDAIATVMGSDDKPDALEMEAQLVTPHDAKEGTTPSAARVLVTEDNAVNQKVAAKMLENLGFRADVAANGLEAVEAVSLIPYAAVLMDVQMPEMDGYEATAEIRRREGPEHHTPIIAMTANAMKGDKEKTLEAGMDDYLPKPVKFEELGAVLQRWIPRDQEVDGDWDGEKDGIVRAFAEPLDHEVIENLRELGGSEMLSELVELFLEDARSSVEVLRGAVKDGDARSVQRAAHSLKGSSGNMGAREMARLCAQLQETGASGDLARAPALLARLDEELARVRPALLSLSRGG